MPKVTAPVRMLGAGFFQEMTGNRKDKSFKVYDTNAFVMEDVEEGGDNDVFLTAEDGWEDDYVESLAAEHDEDATLIVQFEDAVMDAIANDQELSTFFSTYQDARRRLAERNRVRGFWPVRKSAEKGKKGGRGKTKGKGQSLASRIANSYCRICFKRGHWKDECPNNPKSMSNGSTGASSSAPSVAPTSFVTASDMPPEVAHLPFASSVTVPNLEMSEVYYGEIGDYIGVSSKVSDSQGIDCQSRKICDRSEEPQNTEQHESYFASSGTIGVDLGASQTVIGSQQIPELLQKLPAGVRDRVKRTDCNLVFRFGNHQTLTSKHAILLPVLDTWFRIAIVNGNTPFLLSSEFLRKTLKAVIDTEEGTIWSKTLNRSLEVDVNPKNLFLMDVAQLWSETNGQAQPVLTSQVQSTEELKHAHHRVKNVIAPDSRSCLRKSLKADKSLEVDNQDHKMSVGESSDMSLKPKTISNNHPVSRITDCGPKTPKADRADSVIRSSPDGFRVSTPEAVPSRGSESPRCRRSGSDSMDVSEGSQSGTNRVWESQKRSIVHGSLQRPQLDGLWFVSNYEKSEKPAHRKFVSFVVLTLESEAINAARSRRMPLMPHGLKWTQWNQWTRRTT